MNTTTITKRLAATVLLATLFLPLSQCTTPIQITETKVVEQETSVTYAFTAHKWPSIAALATYAAFLWPLILGITSQVYPKLNQKWSIGVLELLLCVGSGFILFMLTFFGSLQYGGYIAWGAIGMYFIATFVALVAHIRKAWGARGAQ